MTPQQLTSLAAEIGADPVSMGYADHLPDCPGRICEVINAQTRTAVMPRMVSARGLASHMPGGPVAAEIVLMKLEGARDAMLASSDAQQKVMGSLLRRQLSFLSGEGLDFGDAALRGMIDQFAALGIVSTAESAALKAIAVQPASRATEIGLPAVTEQDLRDAGVI